MNIHVQATLVTLAILSGLGMLLALGTWFPHAFVIVVTCVLGALCIGGLYMMVWMFLDDETRGN